ncbi:hypothetical protein KSP40_PGU014522 [Platanthera guangdongensis]|uniref:CCT domain-containing protein n=1 Tax=Platanthera guangdongensis TaxID=2320717 RepID=A0ABR2LTG4_9ASPA
MYHSSSSVYDDTSYGSFFDAGSLSCYQPPSSHLSSSLPCSYFLPRSSSSHSLTPSAGLLDPGDFPVFPLDPVRRVFSADDLQCMNGSPAAGEACHPDPTGRIGRYSAEERRERIERYRNKRNQRNFQKKIIYACRKTLADSRPRVRGRFARNGEAEHETEAEAESTENSFDGWNPYGLAIDMSGAGGGGDFWKKMQAALETTDEEESGYDEDLWASFESVITMNLSGGLS